MVDRQYSIKSASNKGTLYQLKQVVNQTSFGKEPKNNMKATEDFLEVVLCSHILAAAKECSEGPNISCGETANRIVERFVKISIPSFNKDNGNQSASSNDQPASLRDQPTSSSDQPATPNDQPTTLSNQPAIRSDHPASSSGQLASLDGQPASSIDQPASSFDQPARVIHQPARVINLLTQVMLEKA